MSFVEFLMQYYVWILVLLAIAIVTVIGFLADKKGRIKKGKSGENKAVISPKSEVSSNATTVGTVTPASGVVPAVNNQAVTGNIPVSGQTVFNPSIASNVNDSMVANGNVAPEVVSNVSGQIGNVQPVVNTPPLSGEMPTNREVENVQVAQPTVMDFSSLTNNESDSENKKDDYQPLSEQRPNVVPKNVEMPTKSVDNNPVSNSFENLLNVQPVGPQMNDGAQVNMNASNVGNIPSQVAVASTPSFNTQNVNMSSNMNQNPGMINVPFNSGNVNGAANMVSGISNGNMNMGVNNGGVVNPTVVAPNQSYNGMVQPSVNPSVMPNSQVTFNGGMSNSNVNGGFGGQNVNMQPQMGMNINPNNVQVNANPNVNNGNSDLWRL